MDLTNLKESINRLWNENLQLKLNLIKPNIIVLDKQASELDQDVSQLRQIQRRIRMQKLHAMRIPKLNMKSRNSVFFRKNNDCWLALTKEVAQVVQDQVALKR